MKLKQTEQFAAMLLVGAWLLMGCEGIDNGTNYSQVESPNTEGDVLSPEEDDTQRPRETQISHSETTYSASTDDGAHHYPVDETENSGKPPFDPYLTRVRVDEGHFNFHKLSKTFAPFGEVLADDGFEVASINAVFTKESLADVDILVIPNALNEADVKDWDLPNFSAFTDDEIAAVNTWVVEGGSLFLIADHMPMPAAAAGLAASFGFGFNDGFLVRASNRKCVSQKFNFDNGRLRRHPIIDGANESEAVDYIVSGCGQGFTIPPEATPILALDEYTTVVLPEIVWTWDEETPAVTGENMARAAAMPYGEGRVAVFGEAGMLTCKSETSGMCNPNAPQNKQLLLNVAHWLDEML